MRAWRAAHVVRSTVALMAMVGGYYVNCLQAQEPPVTTKSKDATDRASPETPEVMHARIRSVAKVYIATLGVMHDRYFHGQRAVVPARAMEDVFSEMESELKIRSQWIAVTTNAMSISHEPKTDIEKQAAAAIAKGQAEFELTIDGTYYLAVPVPLGNNCINCHAGMFREPPKKKHFAGLILSTGIP